jgi:hypothetical protein
MEIVKFEQNTHLTAIYYDHEKFNLFRIHVNVTLADLKHSMSQLNGGLHFRDDKRVTDVDYRHPSVCSDGIVLFTTMKLQNDVDARIMFSIFSKYMAKRPIELDAKLVRFVESICSNLIHLRTFNEIVACMIAPGEDEVEVINLSDP